MAAPDKNKSIIVVKRPKKGGHGHHGGAWKIAYADFVTAMMAFFLLMWLLGSTSKGDLQGIAEYFNSPTFITNTGGSGSGDSSSVIQGGGTDLTRSTGQVKQGINPAPKRHFTLQEAKLAAKVEAERLRKLKSSLEAALENNSRIKSLRKQILLEITRDGLLIQIVDDNNRPMFDTGKIIVKDYMRDLLREIGKVLNEVENKITLSGHTDSTPYQNGLLGYSNWELSAERANAARRELTAGGMAEEKVARVVGLASSAPFNPENTRDAVNRRITILVMNKEAEDRLAHSDEPVAIDGASASAQDASATQEESKPRASPP